MSLDRRTLLKSVAVWAGLAAAPSWLRAGTPAAAKPNILIFMSDDHWRGDSGCYGNASVRTPNIDAFARQGMRFDQVFTPTPICAPSRACFHTGLYPYRNGAYHQHSTVRHGVRGLPQYLAPLGYRCALTGKVDIRPDTVFSYEYMKGGGEKGEVAGAEKFLARVGDHPFCLVVASHWPHRPFAEKAGGITYDPAKVNLPPFLVDTPETRADMARNYGAVTALDQRFAQVLQALHTHGLDDNTVVIYTADHGQSYPFSKWTLYNAGMNNPFIVRWPGKVAPGSSTNALVSFVDVLPTLIDIAGGTPDPALDGKSFRGVLAGAAMNHQDCVFGSYTHIGVENAHEDYPIRAARSPTHHYIRNLAPDRIFTDNLTASGEDARFWPSWQQKAATDPVAAERVKLYQHRPVEELYDLKADPYLLKNIAADPTAQPELVAMRGKVDAWMAQQRDPGKVENDYNAGKERSKEGPALPPTTSAI
jgi:N-sulfoglucosamine sulfohydrolase